MEKTPFFLMESCIVIQNPDGTIQLGTQPHLKEKLFFRCIHCHAKQVLSRPKAKAKCHECGTSNKFSSFKVERKQTKCRKCLSSVSFNAGDKTVHCPECEELIVLNH